MFDANDADFIKVLRHGPEASTPQDRHWAVIWLRPLWETLSGEYAFQVTIQGQPAQMSSSFSVDMSTVEHICGLNGCETEPAGTARKPPRLRHRIGDRRR